MVDEVVPTRSRLPVLEICPECGYSLRGLPGEGRCPECGAAYDGTMIVVYGMRPHSRFGAPSRSRTGLWWNICLVLVFLYLAFLNRHGGPLMAMLSVAWALDLVFGELRSRLGMRHSPFPAPSQVVCISAGCRQREDLVGSLWLQAGEFLTMLFLLFAMGYVLHSTRDVRWAALCGLLLLLRANRYRQIIRMQAESTAGSGSRGRWTPWSRIWEVALIDKGGGRYHMELHRMGWWNSASLDIEFQCTKDEAEALREQIEKWRGKARGQLQTDTSDAA
jgi:hypothetical protein